MSPRSFRLLQPRRLWLSALLGSLGAAGLAALLARPLPLDLPAGDPAALPLLLAVIAGGALLLAGLLLAAAFVAHAYSQRQLGTLGLTRFLARPSVLATQALLLGACVYGLVALALLPEPTAGAAPSLLGPGALALLLPGLILTPGFMAQLLRSLQPPLLAADCARDLQAAVQRVFPDHASQSGIDRGEFLLRMCRKPQEVLSDREGFVQELHTELLLQLATRHDLVLRLRVRPGDFVQRDQPLLSAYPAGGAAPELGEACRTALCIGPRRGGRRDIEAGFLPLVELGLRALSPACNDPATALIALERLGAGLIEVLRRAEMAPFIHDGAGNPRVILRVVEFPQLLQAAFDPIRRSAAGHLNVLMRQLDMLDRLLPLCREESEQAAILQQARLIYGTAMQAARHDREKRDVHERLQALARGARR